MSGDELRRTHRGVESSQLSVSQNDRNLRITIVRLMAMTDYKLPTRSGGFETAEHRNVRQKQRPTEVAWRKRHLWRREPHSKHIRHLFFDNRRANHRQAR